MNKKIKGFDSKLYAWNPVGNTDLSRETSIYHAKARDLIHSIYRTEKLLEEVALPGTKPTLFADFVLPFRNMIIEVHGEQHYKHILHFHATPREFLKAQQRDVKKKDWCEINGFTYIELPYSENLNDWRSRIIGIS